MLDPRLCPVPGVWGGETGWKAIVQYMNCAIFPEADISVSHMFGLILFQYVRVLHSIRSKEPTNPYVTFPERD